MCPSVNNNDINTFSTNAYPQKWIMKYYAAMKTGISKHREKNSQYYIKQNVKHRRVHVIILFPWNSLTGKTNNYMGLRDQSTLVGEKNHLEETQVSYGC